MHSPSRVSGLFAHVALCKSAEVKYSDPFQGFVSWERNQQEALYLWAHGTPGLATGGGTQGTSSEKRGSDKQGFPLLASGQRDPHAAATWIHILASL